MQQLVDPKPRARRLPAEERRRQILDAAVTVFARQGFAGTGTADIAREAAIGEPTIYRYFSNKRDLYLEAIRRGSDEIREHWQAIADEAPDPMTALARVGVWYFQQMAQNPDLLLLRSRSQMETADDEIAATVRDEYRRIVQFVRSLFEDAKTQGMLAADADIETMTWMFMAVGALLDQTEMLGLRDDLPPEQIVRIAQMLSPSGGDVHP